MKRTPLRCKSLTRKPRPGRLEGYALKALRTLVWYREGGRCQDCGRRLQLESGYPDSMHLCHIKSRGAGGHDTPENTRCKCFDCHIGKEHGGYVNNVKPVPAKEKPMDTLIRIALESGVEVFESQLVPEGAFNRLLNGDHNDQEL